MFVGAPSAQELQALRDRVMALPQSSPGVPLSTLVSLGQVVPPGVGVTVTPAADTAPPLVVLWTPARASALLAGLSAREREVAELIGQGRRNKEIAAALYISEATVKDHVHHILKKSGVSCRAELVRALLGR